MDLNLWDEEISVVSNDLAAIKRYHHDTKHKQRKLMISMKFSIFHLQSLLANILNRLGNSAKRSGVLPPRQRSLLHWATIYAGRVQKFHLEKVELLGKKMWIHLVRARLPGSWESPNSEFTDDQLVELSLRLRNLQETERNLRRHLFNLDSDISALRQNYDDLKAIEANREAASTMHGNFGRSVSEALENPMIKAINRFARGVVDCISWQHPSNYSYVRTLQNNISKQTEEVITRCRNNLVEETLYPGVRDRKGLTLDLKRSLEQIDTLESELAAARELIVANPGESHPILLKKKSYQGKRVP